MAGETSTLGEDWFIDHKCISVLVKHINKAYLLKALLICLFFTYIHIFQETS